jgi:hypothetical protein
MTAQPPSRPSPAIPDAEGASAQSLPPPARRGATVIPDNVMARITARAAREALTRQTGDAPARLGLGAPRSKAAVHDGSARLRVSLDLPYPRNIARACEEIRHYIADRVTYLTGMRIDDITVSVQRLVPDQHRGRVR